MFHQDAYQIEADKSKHEVKMSKEELIYIYSVFSVCAQEQPFVLLLAET